MATSVRPGTSHAGTAAERVERFRPGYPDVVVERTLAFAGHPVATAVEVGAGTGKAARAFASRSVRVTALEADPHLLAVLERESLGMQVVPVGAALEEYDGPTVDLVYAAASWHRQDRRTRCGRAAALLEDGGVLALIETTVRLARPEARDALVRAGLPLLEEPLHLDDREPSESGLFGAVEEHRFAHAVQLPHQEYVGYLSTLTAVQEMDGEDRLDLLRRATQAMPAQVLLELCVVLQLARRR